METERRSSPPLFTTFLRRKSTNGKDGNDAPVYLKAETAQSREAGEPDLALLQLRRGSEVSTASSSQAGPSSVASVAVRRTSLSSFASSTGSPRPTVSTFSHATNGTVGELSSTASLPLLQGMTALSPAHEAHSYPPAPNRRPRTGTASSRDSERHAKSKRSSYLNGRSALPPVTNPFAPLRKRLRRSLNSSANKRIAIELQLLVELVDALDALIAASTVAPETLPSGRLRSEECLHEVEILVQELIEVAPDARQCLVHGQYGPLSGGVRTLKRDSYDPSWSEYWPRRLVRDCRAVLDELGFPASLLNIFATPLADDDDEDGINLLGFATPPETSLLDSDQQQQRSFDRDVMKKRRQEELLAEGQKRWQEYLSHAVR